MTQGVDVQTPGCKASGRQALRSHTRGAFAVQILTRNAYSLRVAHTWCVLVCGRREGVNLSLRLPYAQVP